MNEENKRNYFNRRNQILQRNINDAEEKRSKSMNDKKRLDDKLAEELNKKSEIVNSVRTDEKKWNENKRRMWVIHSKNTSYILKVPKNDGKSKDLQ